MDIEKRFEELKPLQAAQCKMLEYVDSFCSENDIEYCVAFGTALGAARHGGPIPWDDDTDIYMPAKDYERFRTLFNEKGDKEHFYLQELCSVSGMQSMPKLRLNGTTFIEKSFEKFDMHHGIYIDIFILHECPPNKFEMWKGVVATCYRTIKELSNRDYDRNSFYKLICSFLRLFPKKFGLKIANKQLYKWDNNPSSDYFADWELYNGHPKWLLPKSVMLPFKKINYNGLSLYAPNDIEKYLEICYGDWRTIPDMDAIVHAQHVSKWSVDKDFRCFLDNIVDFSYEK